jgi:serine/threonine protein kinase
MQVERWQRVEEIVHRALDCEPAEREAFIDSACGGDTELRREVESLLATEHDGGFSTASAFDEGVQLLEMLDEKSNDGRRIGPYRVIRQIGRGGMGSVYLAARADDTFQKLVAIKIIRRGLDTEDIIQRFRNERQILATLDHPNIARLLDGGATEDGLPYFVMEYIEGEPIDSYCNSRRFNITERLKLFQGVCVAVSYAHQNLIVHRDIKPGNVLVNKDGVPRLLDFGIAKLLAQGVATQTVTAYRALTPEYASPEQVRGETISTASDVYSLGVLLYWLVTGRGPYRTTSPSELEHTICEEQPERPSIAVARDAMAFSGGGSRRELPEGSLSKLRKRLEGDVDNIVLMALRKEPHRRYRSAEQLSEDIERHLGNRPVAARPDSRRYRAAKFIQRNKAWVATSAVAVLSLAGGTAVSLWQAHVARTERDTARLEQAKAARVNGFLQEMVKSSAAVSGSSNQKGHEATVTDMLDQAAKQVDTELADQPELRAELLGSIGGTYMAGAKYDRAAPILREAYELCLKLYGPNAKQTAAVMYPLADLAYLKGDYGEADSWFQRAVPIYRAHANDPDFELRSFYAMLGDAGFVKRAVGRLDEAEALWKEALALVPRLPAKDRVGTVKTFLAQLYVDRGDVRQAGIIAEDATRELRAYGRDNFELAQAVIDLGNVRRLERRYLEAETLTQEGINRYTRAQGADHPNVAFGRTSLAMVYYDEGKYDFAEQEARKALMIVEKLPKNHYYAFVQITLGMILNKTGRPREAEPLLREGLAVRLQKSP